MKFIIWEPGPVNRKHIPADAIYVRLIRLPDTTFPVSLCAVDVHGACRHNGSILYFTRDGKITRAMNINAELGLPLDVYGRIRVV